MKDRVTALAKGQDHLTESIDLERLRLDNFAPLRHNEVVLHPVETTLLPGYEGEYLSSFPAEDKVQVDGHQFFLLKHLWKIVADLHV